MAPIVHFVQRFVVTWGRAHVLPDEIYDAAPFQILCNPIYLISIQNSSAKSVASFIRKNTNVFANLTYCELPGKKLTFTSIYSTKYIASISIGNTLESIMFAYTCCRLHSLEPIWSFFMSAKKHGNQSSCNSRWWRCMVSEYLYPQKRGFWGSTY